MSGKTLNLSLELLKYRKMGPNNIYIGIKGLRTNTTLHCKTALRKSSFIQCVAEIEGCVEEKKPNWYYKIS